MKSRSWFLALICSLVVGSSGPVFAAGTDTTRSDQVTSIQNRYNPLFEAQYARLMVIKKKVLFDPITLPQLKAVLVDFAEVRRTIDAGLASSVSDLDAVKAYAEEELGEFDSTLSQLDAVVAKNKTIRCIKGKQIKKVTGLSPKCPKGYKKK